MTIIITATSDDSSAISCVLRTLLAQGVEFRVEYDDEVTPLDSALESALESAWRYTAHEPKAMPVGFDAWNVYHSGSCPVCKAPRTNPCITGSGGQAAKPHLARVRQYFGFEPQAKPVDVEERQALYDRAWDAVMCHPCPTCGSGQGLRCVSKTGREVNIIATHRPRLALVS
jgi:hypothetical protein